MGFVVLSRAGRLAHSWGSESHHNINIADHKVTTVWFYCLWYTGCGIGIMLWCVYDCYDPHCESLTPGYGGSVCCPSPYWLPLCVSALLGLLHLPSSDSLIFCKHEKLRACNYISVSIDATSSKESFDSFQIYCSFYSVQVYCVIL